jgi:predicted MFS family arabinose efflux permease
MKLKIVLFLIIVAVFLIAAAPLQEATNQWRDIFTVILGLAIAALGSPLSQWIKNVLGWSEKAGVAVVVVVAALVALLEIFLSGQFNLGNLTLENFPQLFFLVFSVASIYYGLLKSSQSFFGRGVLLKEKG